MLRDAVVSILLGRLGNRDASEYQSLIETEILQVQENRLEGDATLMPWFLITSRTPTVTSGTDTLAQATDYLMSVEESGLEILNPTSGLYEFLTKDDLDYLQTKYADESAGKPVAYALVGENYRLFPTPDQDYVVREFYYARAVTLNSNIENSWLKYASDLMIAAVGEVMAKQYLQDLELATTFTSDFGVARDRVWKLNEARQHVNRDYQMGDD